MENIPTTSWICDSCKNPINSAADGWVEWLVRRNDRNKLVGSGLRIVHHLPAHNPLNVQCQYNRHALPNGNDAALYSLPLVQYLGANGLMDILAEIDTGRWPRKAGLQMIKRLHIPGYEEARLNFRSAVRAGVFEPNVPHDYYSQENINAVISWVRRGKPPVENG